MSWLINIFKSIRNFFFEEEEVLDENKYEKFYNLGNLSFFSSIKHTNDFINYLSASVGYNSCIVNNKKKYQVTLKIVTSQTHPGMDRYYTDNTKVFFSRGYFKERDIVNFGDVMDKLLKDVRKDMLKCNEFTEWDRTRIKHIDIDCSEEEPKLIYSAMY